MKMAWAMASDFWTWPCRSAIRPCQSKIFQGAYQEVPKTLARGVPSAGWKPYREATR